MGDKERIDAVNVYSSGMTKARSFINQGKINESSPWSFTGADGNKLLGPEGDDWKNFASYHIAEDTDANEETKGRYKYPWGKDEEIYRRGVIAAKSRAAAQGETDISNAADELLQMIDEKLDQMYEDRLKMRGTGTNMEKMSGGGTKEKFSEEGAGTKEKMAACQTRRSEDSMESVARIDFMEMPYNEEEEYDEYLEKPFKRTEEGYLLGRAIFTNIGVFPYRLEDGSVQWELRPPEEVFDYDSMSSFKMLPMTNEHTTEPVTVKNVKMEQVGYSGEEVRKSAFHLSNTLLINDEDTIMEVEEGKRGLSAGYTVDLEDKSGVWMGIPYDKIQRNIRGNHIAIVDKGRAGDDARMRFDSTHSVGILSQDDLNNQRKNLRRKDSMTLKKFTVDGVEYQADAELIALFQNVTKENESLKKDLENFKTLHEDHTTLLAERDQLNEDNETLKKEVEQAKSNSPEEVEALVQERLVVIDAANRANIKIEPSMKEDDIKKAVIVHLFPGSKSKLDNCNEVYLKGRWDGALEKLEEISSKEGNEKLSSDSLNNFQENKPKEDASDTAYNNMVKRQQESWKSNLREEV